MKKRFVTRSRVVGAGFVPRKCEITGRRIVGARCVQNERAKTTSCVDAAGRVVLECKSPNCCVLVAAGILDKRLSTDRGVVKTP